MMFSYNDQENENKFPLNQDYQERIFRLYV